MANAELNKKAVNRISKIFSYIIVIIITIIIIIVIVQVMYWSGDVTPLVYKFTEATGRYFTIRDYLPGMRLLEEYLSFNSRVCVVLISMPNVGRRNLHSAFVVGQHIVFYATVIVKISTCIFDIIRTGQTLRKEPHATHLLLRGLDPWTQNKSPSGCLMCIKFGDLKSFWLIARNNIKTDGRADRRTECIIYLPTLIKE